MTTLDPLGRAMEAYKAVAGRVSKPAMRRALEAAVPPGEPAHRERAERVVHLPSGRKGTVRERGFDLVLVRWDTGWESRVDKDELRQLPARRWDRHWCEGCGQLLDRDDVDIDCRCANCGHQTEHVTVQEVLAPAPTKEEGQ